jgi:hypothetical protein
MAEFLPRRASKDEGDGKVAPSARGILERLPAIWTMLTLAKWPDTGKRRQTSSLSVFVDAGVLKVSLNDKDGGQSCFVTGGTLDDCLEALERALQEDRTDWRKWKR